jgi:hypothetical protein
MSTSNIYTKGQVSGMMIRAKQGTIFSFQTAAATITVKPLDFFGKNEGFKMSTAYINFELQDDTGKKIEIVDEERLRFIFENC